MKSGNLNFLETYGPLQACNGTDLPIYIIQLQRPFKLVARSDSGPEFVAVVVNTFVLV